MIVNNVAKALLPTTLFLVVGVALSASTWPLLEAFILEQIKTQSARLLPVQIQAEEINISFIPPSVAVKKIQVKAEDPSEFGFQQIQIGSIAAHLDFLQLLGGRLSVSSIVTENVQTEIDLDELSKKKTNAPPPTLPWNFLVSEAQRFPLQQVMFRELNLVLKSKSNNFEYSTKDSALRISKNQDGLLLEVQSDSNQVLLQSLRMPLQWSTEIKLDSQKVSIAQFEIKTPVLKSEITGEIRDPKELLTKPKLDLHIKSDAQLASLSTLKIKNWTWPAIKGLVHLDSHVQLNSSHLLVPKAELSATQLSIEKFIIGDIKASLNWNGKNVNIDHIDLANSAGEAQIKNAQIDIDLSPAFAARLVKANVSAQDVDLNELLKILDVGDIPVEQFLDGQLNCQGPAWPNPSITCDGHGHGEFTEVRSGDGIKKTIVQLPSFDTKGQVTITDEKVSYKANIQLQKFTGESSGSISYKNGFNISYSTPMVDFSVLQWLAGLKLEGQGQLSGQTSGDSNSAIFNINFDGKNIWFEDFYLGQLQGQMRYEKGLLIFESNKSRIGSSLFAGEVTVDLIHDQLKASGSGSNFELRDVLKVFQRRFEMPVELSGTGQAEVSVWGPLKLNELSYKLYSSAQRGVLAGENFENAVVNIESETGHAEIKSFNLSKHGGQVTVAGQMNPQGIVNLNIDSNDFPIEQSENISRLGANLSGSLSAHLLMTGPILAPDLEVRSSLKHLLIEEEEFEDSDVNMKITKKSATGKAQLLGSRLNTEFQIPFNDNTPFYFNAKANQWNYTTLLTLIGAGRMLNEYQASVSGDVNLSSEQGGFFKSSGRAQFSKIELKRGALMLQNTGPMEAQFKNGEISLKNFKLSNPKNESSSVVEIRGENFNYDHLDLNIKANSPMRLFQVFMPFFDELGGQLKTEMQVGGSLSNPEILGSASLNDGFLKIKGFPHSFEKLVSDVQFSQKKIVIQSVNGNLAGGTLTGSGEIKIEGLRQLPTQIHASLENASFNVPEGMRTQGSAEVVLSGSWFPFTLSGAYHIVGGSVEEFGDDKDNQSLHASSYLPKFILQDAFEPLLLDLQVILDKPVNIKNSNMVGQVLGQIQIKGPPTKPKILGRISSTRSSQLLFRDKPFEILSGQVNFTNPDEVNPDLYFAARSRVSDYDINLLVQGTAKNPLIRLNSSPPLPEPDIVSLLALGVTSQKSASNTNRPSSGSANAAANQEDAQMQAAQLQIGTALLSNTVAKPLHSTLGLDLQISSRYDDTKNVTVQKVTISRNLGQRLNASASRLKGEQASTEVRLKYLINQNFSAVASWENREATENTTNTTNVQNQSESILGLDLEFRQEFK